MECTDAGPSTEREQYVSARHTPAAAEGSGVALPRSPSGRLLAARVSAWLVVCVYVAGISANFWLERITPVQSQTSAEDILMVVGFGMFAVVGALLVARRPSSLVGWILSATALIVGIFPASESYAAYVMTTRGQPDALAVFGAWANSWYWYLLLTLVFGYLPLLFPDGRLLSRRWLPVAILPGIGVVGMAILGALADTLRGQSIDYRIENPIGVDGLGRVEELPVFGLLGALLAIGCIGAVASVVVRFHRSRGIERQQLKWFAYAAAPILAVPATDYVPGVVGGLVFGWVLIGLPAAIGIAVLKHRLYDIDLVINRTLVYGPLTATLVLIYVGGIAALQHVFRALTGQESQLAIVASTLAIVALFGLLRRRLQDFVDRSFYRQKYDAAKILEAFSAKLRDEVGQEDLSSELAEVVRDTVRPAHVSIWLKDTAAGKNPRTYGR